MAGISRCKRLPSPPILIRSSRTRFPRKLVTIGAAIAIRDDVTPGWRPVPAPKARASVPSESPNSVESMRLPEDIRGELGSAIPRARLGHERPAPERDKSNNFSSKFGSPDLVAIPPSTVPIEDSSPRNTDRSDSPNALAIALTLGLSSVLHRSVNKDIYFLAFVSRYIGKPSRY
jgi:hypothetical protein